MEGAVGVGRPHPPSSQDLCLWVGALGVLISVLTERGLAEQKAFAGDKEAGTKAGSGTEPGTGGLDPDARPCLGAP